MRSIARPFLAALLAVAASVPAPGWAQQDAAPQARAPVTQPALKQAPAPQSEEAPRPRRGRPRKIVEPAAAEAAEGLDMAILPPSIARADNDSEASEEAPKKRTRRPRATTTQAAE